MLKDNYISRIKHCEFSNGGGNFFRYIIIQGFGVTPHSSSALRTMFSLLTLNTVEHMIQMVFFTCKIDKFSCNDSSISSHDATHRVSIETKVYSADTPILNFSIGEFYLFLEGEA